MEKSTNMHKNGSKTLKKKPILIHIQKVLAAKGGEADIFELSDWYKN